MQLLQLAGLLLAFSISLSNAANILAIYFHAGKSHHILGETLLKELARRGHNVTMASTFPLAEPFPNYTDVHLTGILEDQIARESMFLNMNKGHKFSGASDVLNLTLTQTELTLTHPEMKKLVASGTKFDVIIIDWFMNNAILIYGKLFNAPIIPLASSGTTSLVHNIVGNPFPPSYIPNLPLSFPPNMTFLQRALNGILVVVIMIGARINAGYHQNLLEKYFDNVPPFEQLRDNVALVLSNAHYSFEPARPLVPNIIPIGGFHIQQPKELPSELKRFMDEATHGVVYFSLGSNMKSVLIPEAKRVEILQAFAKLHPRRVLWKWESDDLPGRPENVLIRRWAPQNDILAHPNLKLFITHGGLLSTIESLHYGVPIIGIPIFGDQKANVPRAVDAGYALQLELEDLSEETLSAALAEVLGNPKYAENARKQSVVFRDRPMAPMETAVYWVEHVIRHKGAPHLQNAGIRLPWYQYLMVDVVAFLLLLLYIVYRILKVILSMGFSFIYKLLCYRRRSIKIKTN